jgi:DNA-binding NtrC family response regulator
MNILVVDDQRSARRILADMLARGEGAAVTEAGTLDEARRALAQGTMNIALVDIRLDTDARNRDGLTVVSEARQAGVIPIVVTVSNEMAEIRAAMRLGAYDYILKDELCEEMVLPLIDEIRHRRQLEAEVEELRARTTSKSLSELVGTSAVMEKLRTAIRRVALSDRPVLVTGPTGAGKELVVRAIHALGRNPTEPLLDVNCGALPEQLTEGLLFGHERGAYTGADRKQQGYLAAVGKGTLFLDELAELPMLLQAKLLRVIETHQYRPLGATSDVAFGGRIIAATHAELCERVNQHRFREDLYYRLSVLQIQVPALEERREDIPALVARFVAEVSPSLRFSEDALAVLMTASWPGNVRQLRNLIDRVAVFADDENVTAQTLRSVETVPEAGGGDCLVAIARTLLRLRIDDKLTAIEDALVAEALAQSNGNKTAAARLLGVHRKVVERRTDRRESQ